MPETSRECVVVLLDETSFSVPVKPTLLGSDLLDMAASHMKVKEKNYFSLYTEGEGYKNWLEMDKPVLDPAQDLPKGSQPVKIFFCFKYFIHNLRYFNDFMTVELLYLQSRQAIFKGEILTDEETVFELAACVMQAQHGDYKSDEDAKQQLSHLPVLPVNIFNSKSIHYCEERVMSYYRMMNGLSRGEAVFKYLDIIQSLPMYSMHFFEVKDKKDVPLWLGVGPDGICECLKHDKNEQTNRFQWLQLQNIYYKDKKFSMEVYRSNARSGRKGAILGPVSVHAWYGSSSKVIIAIWKMARDQHMFYRSKRTTRDPQAGMNLTEIIRQLNKHHRANISPSSSHSSLSMDSAKSNPQQASAEAVAAAKAAQTEMYQALLSRRAALVIDFEKKAARYKEILIKEMQITGIPPDGLTPEEIERMRKKFGVSFKFSKFVLDKGVQGEEDEVETLEKEVEINQSILRANKTLLDQTRDRKLKKDRKKDIKTMEEKLQKLEGKVEELKKNKRSSTSSTGSKFQMDSPTSSVLALPGSVPVNRRRSGTPGGGSIDDNFLASMIFDTPTKPTSHNTTPQPSNLQKSPLHKSTSALNDMPSATSTPPTGSFAHSNRQHNQVSTSHSMGPGNYQGHPPSSHEHAYSENYTRYSYGNDSHFMVGGDSYADEYDLSPQGSLVSGSGSVFSPPNSNNTSRRSDYGPRESNLTDDFLHHFSSSRGHPPAQHHPHHPQHQHYTPENRSPMTSVRSDASLKSRIPVPRRSNVSDSVTVPANSSPITRYKRASSPTLGFPVEGKAGYVQAYREQREYSPDTHHSHRAPHGGQYDHAPQQQPPHQHYQQEVQYRRNPQTLPHSYQTPSPISAGNYSQHYPQGSSSTGKPPHSGGAPSMSRKAPPTNLPSPQKPHPSQYGGHSGQTRSNALWYDDNSGIEVVSSGNAAAQAGGHPHRMSGGSHVTPSGGHMTSDGQRKNQPPGGQAPPSSQTQGITLPRQQSEESYGLQEILNIWDSSSKSPFGEGTLV